MLVILVSTDNEQRQVETSDIISEMTDFCTGNKSLLKSIEVDGAYNLPAKHVKECFNMTDIKGLIITVSDDEDLAAILSMNKIEYIDIYLANSKYHKLFWQKLTDKLMGHHGFAVQLTNNTRAYYVLNNGWLGTDYNSINQLNVIYDNYPYELKLMVANIIFTEAMLEIALNNGDSFEDYNAAVNKIKNKIIPNLPEKVTELAGFVNLNQQILPHLSLDKMHKLWNITKDKPDIDIEVINEIFCSYLLELWSVIPLSTRKQDLKDLSSKLFSYLTVSINNIHLSQFLYTLDPIVLYNLLNNMFIFRNYVTNKISILSKNDLDSIKQKYRLIKIQNRDLGLLQTSSAGELTLLNSNNNKEITLDQILQNNPMGLINNKMGPEYNPVK